MIQGMKQGMVATPTMQLAMRALQANQTELQELISEALAANPALEEIRTDPAPQDTALERRRAFAMESISSTQTLADYLEEQIRWASKAMQDPLFSSAPVKIALIHVPMIDHPNKDDYHLQRWLNGHFISLLDDAGIDLMINADHHEFMYYEPGTVNNPFPILINDDVRRLDCNYDSGQLTITMYNAAGEAEKSITLSRE